MKFFPLLTSISKSRTERGQLNIPTIYFRVLDSFFCSESILMYQTNFVKQRFHYFSGSLDTVHTVFSSPTNSKLKVLSHGVSAFGVQIASCLFANPTMDSSSSIENPQNMFEIKILTQSQVQSLISNSHKIPTLLKNICFTATSHRNPSYRYRTTIHAGWA